MTTSEPNTSTPPPAGTPPTAPPPAPPAATGTPPPAPAATPDPLDDHEDGLLDPKAADPPWLKQLRTKAAGYRVRAKETASQLATVTAERDALKAAADGASASQRAAQLKAVAEKHGLWDPEANGKKGGLLPGVSLGDDPAKMEELAAALATHLRGKPGGSVAARRPATVAAATSGTSSQSSAGPSRAAEALRALMAERSTNAG